MPSIFPVSSIPAAKQPLGMGSSGQILTSNGPGTRPTYAAVAAPSSVAFPATEVPSADANTLDDYEEGTWTPDLSDGLNNDATQTTEVGTYTKIGRLVHVKCNLTISSLGTVSGSLQLDGLPFASNSTASTSGSGSCGKSSGLAITASMNITCIVEPNTSSIVLKLWDATTGQTGLQESELSADGVLVVDATYYV